MTRIAGLAIMLALGTAMVACGGGGDDGGDSGPQRYEDAGLAVEYPERWEPRELSAEEMEDGLRLLALGPTGNDGQPVRLSVFRQQSQYASIEQYGSSAADTRAFQLNEGLVVGDRETDVTGGAGRGWLVQTDYVYAADDARRIPSRWIDVLARSGDEQFRLTLTGPRERMGDADIERIVRSFRVP